MFEDTGKQTLYAISEMQILKSPNARDCYFPTTPPFFLNLVVLVTPPAEDNERDWDKSADVYPRVLEKWHTRPPTVRVLVDVQE